MKNFPNILSTILFLLFFVASTQTFATVIQFEGAVLPGQGIPFSSYSEGGYTFTSSNSALSGFVSSSFNNGLNYAPPTSSNYMSLCACSNLASAEVTIARTDNSQFSLNSLDAGFGQFLGSAASITLHVTGTKADSSTFESTFVLNNDNQWHSASFTSNPAFSNLQQLTIYGGGISSALAIDNINVSEVPVPAAAWLFGSSVFALASLRRRIA